MAYTKVDFENRKVLGETKVEDNTKVVVSLVTDSNSKNHIDIRKYFKKYSGEWIATKKGVLLSPNDTIELLEILNSIDLDTDLA